MFLIIVVIIDSVAFHCDVLEHVLHIVIIAVILKGREVVIILVLSARIREPVLGRVLTAMESAHHAGKTVCGLEMLIRQESISTNWSKELKFFAL